jgi:hypothetical protein
MISATLLALVAAATPATPPTAGVFLKASVATAPACRTTRVDDRTVRATLFSPDSEQCPVAAVGDEQIVLGELAGALETSHLARSPGAAAPAKRPEMDFAPALDRLIAIRLLVLEGREMRLDEAPAFKSDVDEFSSSRLRQTLLEKAARSARPDPAEVERLYRDAVREWKLKSILIEKEDAAKAFAAELKASGNASFDALAKKWVDAKKAQGGGPAEFASRKHMVPELVPALQGAKPGVPLGPIQVPTGWVLVRIDIARYPAGDEAARAEARAKSLARMQHQAVRQLYLSLVAKYASVDQKLVKSLDLEAGGAKGFEALLQDARPLAKIQGEKPLTVADLTLEVAQKFFHGLDSPIREHRVNREKMDTFERLLGNRLFAKEAAARKLDARPEHRRAVAEFERGRLFDTFVGTVIAPDVKVTEQDAIVYYEKHKGELTAPEMFKLDGFAFATGAEAQGALNKLKGGTDYPWLRQTAPGQLPPEKRSIQLDGQTLSATALPKDLAAALTGTKSGEYRLYAAKPTEVWVVRVVEQSPPRTQPYADARETIAKSLFNERLAAAIDDYARKLRKAQRVDVLITRVTL